MRSGESRRGDVKMEEHVRVVGPINGKFHFTKAPTAPMINVEGYAFFVRRTLLTTKAAHVY